MKAKSIKGNSTEEISAALSGSMTDGFKPTLAIVFLSMKQDRNAISKLLGEKGVSVFGATTNGEFIDESLGRESVVMLLLDMNPAYFNVLFTEYPEKNYREVARQQAEKAKQLFPN
ncbi:MAG TPA: hypothetical protein VI548_12545, partial [Chitinophagaceae bacterium]|nr:hypothetical protein [Chitinophagaceae bacterium]